MRVFNCTAACLALILVAATFTDAHKPRCKVPKAASSSSTAGSRRQDADGVTRTTSGCSYNGTACETCCDGECCEDVSTVDGSVPTTPLWIGLRFAFIAATDTEFTRATSTGKLDENIRVMNAIFAPLNIFFHKTSVMYYSDARMVTSCDTNTCDDPATCDFNQYTVPRVKANSSEELPVLICDNLPFLGEASLPWTVPEDDVQNFILVDSSTIGASHPDYPTGLGYTLVHEMGHSFGLFHVFGDQCAANGDFVADTSDGMVAADEDNDCDDVLDTCTANPGNDMLQNYMNYASDSCMTEFTDGQKTRMLQSAMRWRTILTSFSGAPTGTCPTTATNLSDCACGNGLSPESRCNAVSADSAPTAVPDATALAQSSTAAPTAAQSSTAAATMPTVDAPSATPADSSAAQASAAAVAIGGLVVSCVTLL